LYRERIRACARPKCQLRRDELPITVNAAKIAAIGLTVCRSIRADAGRYLRHYREPFVALCRATRYRSFWLLALPSLYPPFIRRHGPDRPCEINWPPYFCNSATRETDRQTKRERERHVLTIKRSFAFHGFVSYHPWHQSARTGAAPTRITLSRYRRLPGNIGNYGETNYSIPGRAFSGATRRAASSRLRAPRIEDRRTVPICRSDDACREEYRGGRGRGGEGGTGRYFRG